MLKPAFDGAPQFGSEAVRTPDGTIAISATGNLDADALAQLLRAVPAEGTYELCCHPGYNDADLDLITTRLREHRNVEREALLAEVPRALCSRTRQRSSATQISEEFELGLFEPQLPFSDNEEALQNLVPHTIVPK